MDIHPSAANYLTRTGDLVVRASRRVELVADKAPPADLRGEGVMESRQNRGPESACVQKTIAHCFSIKQAAEARTATVSGKELFTTTHHLANSEDTPSLDSVNANLLPLAAFDKTGPVSWVTSACPHGPVGRADDVHGGGRCEALSNVHLFQKRACDLEVVGQRLGPA